MFPGKTHGRRTATPSHAFRAAALAAVEQLEDRRLLTGVDDALEVSGLTENDAITEAYSLGLVHGRLTQRDLVALDDDWYHFQTDETAGAGNFVRIEFATSAGDLDLRLYDGTGTLVGYSEDVGNVEDISLDGMPADDYYIHVYGYRGATNPNYTLRIDTPPTEDDDFEVSSDVPLEQNDALLTATDLGLMVGANEAENLVAADDDYYRFGLGAEATADSFIRIDFLQRAGDLDLYLFDSDGFELARSSGVGDFEQVSLAGLEPGAYYIRVHGYRGAVNSDYTLNITTPVMNFQPDAYDAGALENNTFASASDLGPLSGAWQVSDLTIHDLQPGSGESPDIDYFAFTLEATGKSADYAQIRFTHADGDLDLHLYDANRQLLDYSTSTTDDEIISLAGYPAGSYYIKIFGYASAVNAYDLIISAPEAAVGGDGYEPNNDLANAGDLRDVSGALSIANLTIQTTTDQDYFRFETGAIGSAADSVSISFTHAAGDLDLELLDENGQLLARSDGTADGEAISLEDLPAGTYYLHVYGYRGAVNRYDLSIDAPLDSPVVPDAWETGQREPIALARSQTLTGLSIHDPADWTGTGTADDTFTFTTLAAGAAGDFVEIHFAQASGALTMALQRDGGSPITATLSADSARISLAGLPAGNYTLTVSGVGGATNPDYSLTLAASFSATPTLPEWTFLIYMDGDNTLESAAIEDINEMEAARLPGSVQVGLLVDRIPGDDSSNGNWTDTRVGVLQADNNTSRISTNLVSSGELNMADPNTLIAFIEWGKENLPAQNYALILWDHGGATLGSMEDDTDGGDLLTLAEMRTALAGQGISVLGFDACLMATLEVAYSVRDSVDYMVASEETEGGDGWDYTQLFNTLAARMPASPEQVASLIVESNRNNPSVSTLSAIRVAGQDFRTPLTGFVTAFNSAVSAEWDRAAAARNAAPSYYFPMFRDLGEFMTEIAARTANAAIRTAANAVLSTYYDAIVNSFARASVGGTGLSIYLPSPEDGVWSDYRYLDFPYHTGWNRFVSSLSQRTGGTAAFDRDWAENNEVRSTARDLGTLSSHGLSYPNLSINQSGDLDWFRFTTLAAGQSGDTVRIDFTHAAGNLSLYLYDNQGTQIRQSLTTGNFEQISLQGLAAGQYFILVSGVGSAVNPDYTLTINAPLAAQTAANISAQKAQLLPLNTFQGGQTVDAAQSLWYLIDAARLPVTDPLTVEAVFDLANSVAMALYAPGDTTTPVSVSQSTADGARLVLPDLGAGRFYLKVTGTAADTSTFALRASHQAQVMNLQGNQLTIPSGSTTTSTLNWTHYGSVGTIGSTVVRTFTIWNLGATPLNLTGNPRVVISGKHAADFRITRMPNAVVQPGGYTFFRVVFDPSATGKRYATITVASDDRAHNPYTFNIQGSGILAPFMSVRMLVNGKWSYIADGQTTPAIDFGTARRYAAMPTRTFWVYNGGNATLNLTLRARDLPAGFTIVEGLNTTLASGKWESFTLGLLTSSAGTFTGDIRVYSNDTPRNPFSFRVTGTVSTSRTASTFSTGPRIV